MLQQLEDWIAETPESIAARLDAVKTLQRQTQFTIGVQALVSMMMLIAAYNAYLSFDSEWVTAQVSRRFDGEETVASVLTEHALNDWADSRTVNLSLIGIRLSVDDAPVLGTSSLLVFSLWLVLLMRRENHTIGFLLRDTDTPSEDRADTTVPAEDARPHQSSGHRWLIYHTIVANSLFVTFDRSMSHIRELHGTSLLGPQQRARRQPWWSRLGLAFVHRFFFWFPVAASAVVFYLDRRSYFLPDPFLGGAQPLGLSAPFFLGSSIVFLCCWIPLFVCAIKASQYSSATENVLREYGTKLRVDLVRQQKLQHLTR